MDLKGELHASLQVRRGVVVAKCEGLLDLYARACAHGDQTIAALDLDSPGSVPPWSADRRATTLGALLVRMVDGTRPSRWHPHRDAQLRRNRPGATRGRLA